MPELPDVTVYIEQLQRRVRGATLERARIASPNVLRTYDPSYESVHGRRVLDIRRVGKRIVFALEGDLFLAIHLMIAGRLQWKEKGAALARRVGLAALDFSTGTLVLNEAATKQRAAIHVLAGEEALAELDAGGIDPVGASLAEFAGQLARENHTLKRALTDPRFFSGIGNAYSDEILHRAKLSPMKLTSRLTEREVACLHAATRDVLVEWTETLRAETGDEFPTKVTAFRPAMAVHGRYRQPCPDCGTPVQRIVHADNETNYCPTCQTGGRLLADRALSRLLREDWPKTLEELEEKKRDARG